MMNESHMVFLVFGAVLIILIFFVLIVVLCIAYFRMGDILNNLTRSSGVASKIKCVGWSPVSRFFFITYVGALMLFPKQVLKNGELSFQDYKMFPVKLKRLIRFACGSMLILGGIALGFVVVGRYMDWLS